MKGGCGHGKQKRRASVQSVSGERCTENGAWASKVVRQEGGKRGRGPFIRAKATVEWRIFFIGSCWSNSYFVTVRVVERRGMWCDGRSFLGCVASGCGVWKWLPNPIWLKWFLWAPLFILLHCLSVPCHLWFGAYSIEACFLSTTSIFTVFFSGWTHSASPEGSNFGTPNQSHIIIMYKFETITPNILFFLVVPNC